MTKASVTNSFKSNTRTTTKTIVSTVSRMWSREEDAAADGGDATAGLAAAAVAELAGVSGTAGAAWPETGVAAWLAESVAAGVGAEVVAFFAAEGVALFVAEGVTLFEAGGVVWLDAGATASEVAEEAGRPVARGDDEGEGAGGLAASLGGGGEGETGADGPDSAVSEGTGRGTPPAGTRSAMTPPITHCDPLIPSTKGVVPLFAREGNLYQR